MSVCVLLPQLNVVLTDTFHIGLRGPGLTPPPVLSPHSLILPLIHDKSKTGSSPFDKRKVSRVSKTLITPIGPTTSFQVITSSYFLYQTRLGGVTSREGRHKGPTYVSPMG